MAIVSAGLLLYRRREEAIEVLVAHPGGPIWAKKDAGAWTIPKGLLEPGEDALVAAEREFAEELGIAAPPGPRIALGEVRLRSGKRVVAWAVEGDLDPRSVASNHFDMEWPPKSGRLESFPEVDRAQWVPVADAATKLVEAQVPLVKRLVEVLATGPPENRPSNSSRSGDG